MRGRFRLPRAATALGALVVAGCATSGATADSTTLPTLAPTVAPLEATTTTSSSTTTTSPPPAPTPAPTAPPVPVWPLTGLPGVDPARANLPALIVKIDNHREARPQVGLMQADVVFEEIVEGITRFFAIFHSTGSDPVGPVRSARTTDIDLLAGLNHPLLAWSGGNNLVVDALRRENVATDVGYAFKSKEGRWYRERSRKAPHNLFSTTSALWAQSPPESSAPPPLFTYGPTPPGVPVVAVKLKMAATRVLWQWDAATRRWIRFQDDTPHTDASGAVLNADNVVVMVVQHRPSPADFNSPEAVTVGEGPAFVVTGGSAVAGRWVRPDRSKPAVFIDAAGAPIPLSPGRTWVELAGDGGSTLVPAGVDPASVPYPG